MPGETRCPACLEPISQPPIGRPRIWCDGGCSDWVLAVGGPSRAAEIKEAWAATWERMGRAYGRDSFARKSDEVAAQRHAEAEALRALARGTSNTCSGLSGAPERRERGS